MTLQRGKKVMLHPFLLTVKVMKFTCLLLCFYLPISILCDPIVTTEKGVCYKGKWTKNGQNEERFASFQGIKYGQDPVGNLRFKAPKPFNPGKICWDVSNSSKIACSQNGMESQENCLVLNVFVPEMAFRRNKSLPVMVWIHGGGFFEGKRSLFKRSFISDLFRNYPENRENFLEFSKFSGFIFFF